MEWIVPGALLFVAASIALAIAIGKMIKRADDNGY